MGVRVFLGLSDTFNLSCFFQRASIFVVNQYREKLAVLLRSVTVMVKVVIEPIWVEATMFEVDIKC